MKVLFLIFFSLNALYSKDVCLFNAEVKDIYQEILKLNLDQASYRIHTSLKINENFAFVLLEDYVDFFQLFNFESNTDFEKLIENKKTRLNNIKNSKLEMEWSLFLQGEILLHWSLIHLKRNENLKAFLCVKESIQKLELCKSKFPNFIYCNKSLGILHTLIGTIPEEFDWTANLLGFTGNIESGKKELIDFIDFSIKQNDIFKLESIAAYSFIISYIENKPKKALQFWQQNIDIKNRNILSSMIFTKLLIRSGEPSKALMEIHTYSTSEKNKLPYLYFISGLLKLQELNKSCEEDFQNYLRVFKGNSFKSETYQKLAWNSLIFGSSEKYPFYMQKCLEVGNAITDEDKQAIFEARTRILPDVLLLKARLLSDGFNNNRAYNLLIKHLEDYYKGNLKLEYCYRLGRVCQLLGKNGEALSFYSDAIETDLSMENYMSCFALLNSGIIQEEYGDKSVACKFFSRALNLKPGQYSSSLHQKAKSGLFRQSCIK
ncbi:MAG: hypothetical protein ABI851_00900 [Saprospiraceae bacterium]